MAATRENVVCAGTTRDIGGRTVQAQQHLAVGACAANQAHEFAGDVAGIQNRGKSSTFARPATWLSCSLREATSGTSAASTCNSPSKSASMPSWRRLVARLREVAACTPCQWRDAPALPFVENDNNATRGRTPSRCRQRAARWTPRCPQAGPRSVRESRRSRP